ncbi:hypothetical protein KIPB_003200, partial [Kipferlia bialata]|eukprot:g3200.t1
MYEDAIAGVLSKVLGDFVQVDGKDLNVSLTSGHVELRNVLVNRK